MNTLLTLAYKLSQMVWKVTRPITIGVRVVLARDGTFMLVKPSYQTFWTLPGGGVEPAETLEQTARREIMEEAGAEAGPLRLLGVYTNFLENKSDHIVVFAADRVQLVEDHRPDAEIEQLGFFKLDDLPENTAPGARRRLEEYLSGSGPYFSMW